VALRDSALILAAVLLAIAIAWPALPHARADATDGSAIRTVVEWPMLVEGELLRPLAMGDLEQRFAARFPGAISRFASDDALWILRRVDRPTRMLHPAADCFRAAGYAIREERLVAGKSGLRRCFTAARERNRMLVCEQIVGADGESFTDTSAWYWAAALGRTRGPWLATTRAEPI